MSQHKIYREEACPPFDAIWSSDPKVMKEAHEAVAEGRHPAICICRGTNRVFNVRTECRTCRGTGGDCYFCDGDGFVWIPDAFKDVKPA